ncbi:type II toxin-antitoxin system RelE/ParE family toxin [Pseudomonas mosselii]|nr:type II toxin-antitoxin system RelE/ParE family toxin [Pseudomonas mosselii]
MLRISDLAANDIVDTLRFTEVRLGQSAKRQYCNQLLATLHSLAEEPVHTSSSMRDELLPGLRSLHLSSNKIKMDDGRIISPRHIVFYRTGTDQTIEIIRLLHDAMEIPQHLNHLHQQ